MRTVRAAFYVCLISLTGACASTTELYQEPSAAILDDRPLAVVGGATTAFENELLRTELPPGWAALPAPGNASEAGSEYMASFERDDSNVTLAVDRIVVPAALSFFLQRGDAYQAMEVRLKKQLPDAEICRFQASYKLPSSGRTVQRRTYLGTQIRDGSPVPIAVSLLATSYRGDFVSFKVWSPREVAIAAEAEALAIIEALE